MPFQFIDNNFVSDGATRKRIRAHAATGSNAGKKISRASLSRQKGSKSAAAIRPRPLILVGKDGTPPRDARVPVTVAGEEQDDKVSRLFLARQVGDDFSELSLPASSRRALGPMSLIKKAFLFIRQPRYAQPVSDVVRHAPVEKPLMWIQLMFVDEAYFHGAVALSITAINNISATRDGSAEALRHASETFRLMNKRLSSAEASEAASDESMAVVILMAHYEHTVGHHGQILVHFGGLLRMVQIRGGIDQVAKENSYLVQKIFRTDLECALLLGSSTHFAASDVKSCTSQRLTSELTQHDAARLQAGVGFAGSETCQLGQLLRLDMRVLLSEMTALSGILNDATLRRRDKLDNRDLLDCVLILGYRLVHAAYFDSDLVAVANCLDSAACLGLMAFLVTFMPGFDGEYPSPPVLHRLATATVRQICGADMIESGLRGGGREARELLLWALWMGHAASVFGSFRDESRLMLAMSRILCVLEVNTFEEAVQVMSKFPWMNSMHDGAGRALWERYVMFHGRGRG